MFHIFAILQSETPLTEFLHWYNQVFAHYNPANLSLYMKEDFLHKD